MEYKWSKIQKESADWNAADYAHHSTTCPPWFLDGVPLIVHFLQLTYQQCLIVSYQKFWS